MIRFERVKAGMTLYDVHRSSTGLRTTMGTWPVYVEEVYPEIRAARVRWNGNKPAMWGESMLCKLQLKPYGGKKQ